MKRQALSLNSFFCPLQQLCIGSHARVRRCTKTKRLYRTDVASRSGQKRALQGPVVTCEAPLDVQVLLDEAEQRHRRPTRRPSQVL